MEPAGFQTSIHTEVIDPFGMEDSKDSPCLLSDLEITYSGNIFYTLKLLTKRKYNNITYLFWLQKLSYILRRLRVSF
jgi:hypothetical protein